MGTVSCQTPEYPNAPWPGSDFLADGPMRKTYPPEWEGGGQLHTILKSQNEKSPYQVGFGRRSRKGSAARGKVDDTATARVGTQREHVTFLLHGRE